MTQRLVGVTRPHPSTDTASAGRRGRQETAHSTERTARRFENPAKDTPCAARQVLDHHQRHRAERDAEENM